MNLILSLAIAILFGCGTYLMLKHDLVRLAIGVILISNGANLLLVSMGLSRGVAPIFPLPPDGTIADPVSQALALTSIVITFGVSTVLLALMYRVYLSHRSIDLDDLARAEVEDQARLEREEADE